MSVRSVFCPSYQLVMYWAFFYKIDGGWVDVNVRTTGDTAVSRHVLCLGAFTAITLIIIISGWQPPQWFLQIYQCFGDRLRPLHQGSAIRLASLSHVTLILDRQCFIIKIPTPQIPNCMQPEVTSHYVPWSVYRIKHRISRKQKAVIKCVYRTKQRPGRSQWPRGLRRRSTAARLLRLRFRIPPGSWMSVSCECCVLSGRGLYDELNTRREESYRLCCVVMLDLETSRMRTP